MLPPKILNGCGPDGMYMGFCMLLARERKTRILDMSNVL